MIFAMFFLLLITWFIWHRIIVLSRQWPRHMNIRFVSISTWLLLSITLLSVMSSPIHAEPKKKSIPALSKDGNRQHPIFLFKGLHIPGTAKEARDDGFTKCKYSPRVGHECTLNKPLSLYGVPVLSAAITLNDKDNMNIDYKGKRSHEIILRNVPIESLTYREISIRMKEATWDSACINSWEEKIGKKYDYKKNKQCRQKGSYSELEQALLQHGWKRGPNTTHLDRYYRKDTPIYFIFVYRMPNDTSLYLSPISIEEANEQIKQGELSRKKT